MEFGLEALEGRYEIAGLLGEGGFGRVYRANQVATGQSVAIKFMRGVNSTTRRERFRREVRLCAQLHHPHIVRILDAGELDDGKLYSVFEYVPGVTLAQYLRQQGPLPMAQTLRLNSQILDALAAAHGAGVVHRDLKPGNIMVTDTGARPNVKVLDFGLGGLVDQTEADLTAAGAAFGTPLYASPEQLRGERPDASGDLYAWGLIFAECVTGRPIMADNSSALVIRKQLSSEPVPLPPIADAAIADLLRHVTSKDREKRKFDARSALAVLDGAAPVDRNPTWDQEVPEDLLAPTIDLPGGEEVEVVRLTVMSCRLTLAPLDHRSEDIEVQERLLRTHQAGLADLLARCGGQIVGRLGDRMLVHFRLSADQRVVDTATAASRAALTVVEDTALRSASLEASEGLRLTVRIGVHTGPMVADEHGGSLAGPTIGVASEIETRADPAEVLLSAETADLVRRTFLVEERTVAGRRVARLLSESVDPTSQRKPSAFVGRDDEVRWVLDSVRRAAAGRGACLVVVGEPGVGKSRLAAEVHSRLKSEDTEWWGISCSRERASTPLYPLIELLGERLGRPLHGQWAPGAALASLERLLAGFALPLGSTVPLFADLLAIPTGDRYPLPPMSPADKRAAQMDALAGLLTELAERRPLVLCVDDVQWADPSTVEFLGALGSELDATRVLVLLLARPEADLPSFAADQRRLRGLGAAETRSLVRAARPDREWSGETLDLIAQRSDGIPLFVEELAAALEDSDHGGVPPTLHDLLAARLQRLGSARRTLLTASVLGPRFTTDELAAVESSDEQLAADLRSLADAHLLVRKRRLSGDTWSFNNVLVRDTVYAMLPGSRRRAIHARVAELLEAQGGDSVAIARHHREAGQLEAALGHGLAAAMHALMASAYAEAIELVEATLPCLEALADDVQRAEAELDLYGVLAPALTAQSGFASPRLHEVFARGHQLVKIVGNSQHAPPMLWMLRTAMLVQGHPDEARRLTEQFVAIAREAGDAERESLGLMALGMGEFFAGEFSVAAATLQASLDLYDEERHRAQAYQYGMDSKANAHCFLAGALFFLGDLDGSLREIRACQEWVEELGHGNTTGAVTFGLASIQQYWRRPDRVVQLTDRLRAVNEEHPAPINLLYGNVLRAWADRDLATGGALLQAIDATGMSAARSYWAGLVGEIELELGDLPGARDRLDQCYDTADDTAVPFYASELLRLSGLASERLGDLDRAEERYRGAVRRAQRQGALMLEIRGATALAGLLLRAGRTDEARVAAEVIASRCPRSLESPDVRAARDLLHDLG